MPDDEERDFAILVRGCAPAEGFGDQAPGHGSPPSDEVGGTSVELVARRIDHEAETADMVFVGRHEIAALLDRAAITAERGDAFGHAGMVIGANGRDHDPVGGVVSLERAVILLVRFAWQELAPMNRLPGVRIPIPDRAIGVAPFVVREQFRKCLRHGSPCRVFFIPAAPRAKGRVDLRVMRGIEMETAVASGRMTHDAVGIDGRTLGGTPRRVRRGANLAPSECGTLALVLSVLVDASPEGGLVREFTAVTVEVGPCPFLHWPREQPGRGEIEPTICARHHSEGVVEHLRDEKPVAGSGKQNPRGGGGGIIGFVSGLRCGHAALPPQNAVTKASSPTSSSTASG
ncbi:hypothetical protein GW17_00055085 [Ensete ventricosum]|nr:hypothetical protein GW17_00055085 [Ensete ventricosum]